MSSCKLLGDAGDPSESSKICLNGSNESLAGYSFGF